MAKNTDNPEETKEEVREVPIVEDDFAKLLQKFKIKSELAANIAENISLTGGAYVFEDPTLLTKRLSAWSGEMAPTKRKLVIEQWFAARGVDVPPELVEKAGLTTEQLKKAETEGEKEGKVKYVYDTEQGEVRMVKKDEPGGTLTQAKQLKEMAEKAEGKGGESPFILSSEGGWTLNPKAKITGMEFLAYETIKRAQERGETIDPLDAMTQAAEKMKVWREAVGGGGTNIPTWMTDPVQFINTVRTVTGEGGASDGLKTELAEMRKKLDDMKEERYREQVTALREHVTNLTQKVTELTEAINDPIRRAGAKSEMDILYQIATEGIGFFKTELPNVRRDLKDGLGGLQLPAGKTPEQREERKKGYKKALQADRELETLGRHLFFDEG